MIILLHGDNIEASRKEFVSLIAPAQATEVRKIEGKTADATALTQALESTSLLSEGVVVAIENLFSKIGKKEKLIAQYAAILAGAPEETTVVLWEEKVLTEGLVKKLGKNVRVQLFKIPAVIFQFLDGLRPGNEKSLLRLLDELLAHEAPELVWALMVRRVRQLVMLSHGVVPPGLQGWQASRLTSQGKSFTMEKLRFMQSNLLEKEYALKTGAAPFGFPELIKQVVLEIT